MWEGEGGGGKEAEEEGRTGNRCSPSPCTHGERSMDNRHLLYWTD